MKLFGIISVGFDVTDQLLIKFSAFVRYWRKKWEYNESVHQLFIDFKEAYESVRREVLYNILIEFAVPTKLIRLIKMYLNETYTVVPWFASIIRSRNMRVIQSTLISKQISP
jgi:hypothetical protein